MGKGYIIRMIPRLRPFFNKNYIEVVKNFDPEIPRDEHVSEISKKLRNYYRNAKRIEFLDYGKSSLSIALDILEISSGDEILVAGFNYPLILKPILERGIIPLLIDVNFDFSMDLDQMKDKISKRTKAVLVTYIFGIPGNVREIKEFADEHGLFIIEDCAHIFNSDAEGIELGNIGDMAFTSFKNDKPLSLGRGSILLVNNDDFVDKSNYYIDNLTLNSIANEKVAFLSLMFFYINTRSSVYERFLDIDNGYYHYLKENLDIVDSILIKIDDEKEILQHYKDFNKYINSKIYKSYHWLKRIYQNQKHEHLSPTLMNHFSMNLLNNSIKYMGKINKNRVDKTAIYGKELKNNQDIFAPVDLLDTPILRYPIICKDCDKTRNLTIKLVREGFEVGNFNWDKTLNAICNYKEVNLEKSEFISRNIINLPNHLYVKDREISKICDIINNETT